MNRLTSALLGLRPESPVGAGSVNPDDELLHRYVEHRDQDAFAELMKRHASLVHGVCRRVLHDHHEAEDAAQATFLVLARKAAGIRRRSSLSAWLHGVAYHLSLRVRTRAARQKTLSPRPVGQPVDPLTEVSGRELVSVLDEELSRLPDHYRAPLLLCYLEGLTQDEAARRLGWSEGVLRGRVDRGRAQLRIRLGHRGLTLPAVLAAAGLAQGMPAGLVEPTARAADLAADWVRSLFLRRAAVVTGLLLTLTTFIGVGSAWRPQADEPVADVGTPAPAPPMAPRVDHHGDPLPEHAVARLGTQRLRHGGTAFLLGFANDGKTLLSFGEDGGRRWDSHTGRALGSFGPGKTRGYRPFVVFSPDGTQVAIGEGHKKEIHLWNIAQNRVERTIPPREQRSVVLFSPDGRTLACLNFDGMIETWDVATATQVAIVKGHEKAIWGGAFSTDGKSLFTGGDDKMIRVWDTATLRSLRQIEGSPTTVGPMAASADGKMLATLGKIERKSGTRVTGWDDDRVIRLWDVATGKELHTLSLPEKKPLPGMIEGYTSLAFSPDSTRLATTAWDGSLRIWDVNTGKVRHHIANAAAGMSRVAFAPDGRVAVTHGSGIRLFDSATGRNLFTPSGHAQFLYSAAILPDGKTLATTGDGPVHLWDLTAGRHVRTLGEGAGIGMDLQPNQDGRLLYSLRNDKSLRALDVATGEERRRFPGTHATYGSSLLALSPDGKILAEGGERNVRLFDAEKGDLIRTLTGLDGSTYGVSFLQGGAQIAAWDTVQVCHFWDVATGKKLRQFAFAGDTAHGDGPPSYHATITPDERLIAFASQHRFLSFHDLQSGKLVRRVDNLPDGPCPITFSPCGRFLAWSGWWGDPSVHLLEVATGKDRRRFVGHGGRVLALNFTPDGRSLVSGGEEAYALVWDVTGVRTSKSEPATEDDLAALGSDDSTRADVAVRRLVGSPSFTLPKLGEELRPILPVEEKRFAQLIRDLDADEFATRQAAADELERQGDAALSAMRKALAGATTPEVRLRLERLIEASGVGRGMSPARLRQYRALEVLERLGTKEAKDLLDKLAKGGAGAWLTEEARAALRRAGQ